MSDEQPIELPQAIDDVKGGSLKKTAADEERDRLLQAMLEVEVESFEQATTYTLLMQREAALSSVQRRIDSLEDASSSTDLWSSMIMSLVLGIGTLLVQSLLDRSLEYCDLAAPTKFWVALNILGAIGIVVVVWIGHLFWKLRSWNRTYQKRQFVKRMLQEVSEAYGVHSIRDLRQQEGRQRRVAREALLRPVIGKSWDDIADTGRASHIRSALQKTAEIEGQRLSDARDYAEKGGDYVLELLEACSRDEIPTYAGSYLVSGLEIAEAFRHAPQAAPDTQRFASWQSESLEYLTVLETFGEEIGCRSPKKAAATQLRDEILKLNDFDKEGIERLIKSCSEAPYFFRGPRHHIPPEFVFGRPA